MLAPWLSEMQLYEVRFLQTWLDELDEKAKEVYAFNVQSHDRDNQSQDDKDESASEFNDASNGKPDSNQACSVSIKFKILKPKALNGNRNVKELENAKLWWRSKVNEIQNGQYTIDTWEDLKKELRVKFFLKNVEFIARRKLRELRHMRIVRDYVKQFFGIMLDIRDMLEKDKVFCFVEGLKLWSRTKLYEQKVQDLASALADAERLFEYGGEQESQKKNMMTLNP
ncbi:uncharacterized protein E5676_scaffold299G001440 [Cucumis melo var. makuwa]|uniref:Retrotransposon gag domain-containing protein n=1 Tax=Cucumis melo var. makuwa TaxID=1194695 RepID=A0A5D3CP27_CUCMM|nr:uncharacterized protein E5676_scaffold299G001440 [Cucumis melo var. makuwa]